MEKAERGVFCIESVGQDESFEPTLALLRSKNQLDFPRIIKSVQTRRQLTKTIEEWGNRPNYKYPLLWMWGHGSRDGFYVDDPTGAGNSRLDLGTLADIATSGSYNWSGCFVHFGACSTLAGYDDAYRSLLQTSGLQGISGYSKDVDWIRSFAFEMLYMQFLQRAMTASWSKQGLDEETLAECRDRISDSRMCSGLIDHLGFRMVTRADFDL